MLTRMKTIHTVGGNVSKTTVENSTEVVLKIKNASAMPILDIYSKIYIIKTKSSKAVPQVWENWANENSIHSHQEVKNKVTAQ